MVFGIVIAVILAAAAKVAYGSWLDRQSVYYVRNKSGLVLPVGSKIIAREEASSIIPPDGYGVWVIELPEGPELGKLQQCASPGFAMGVLEDARLDSVLLEKFVATRSRPVCYRSTLSQNGSEIEIFVIQGRKLVYYFRY